MSEASEDTFQSLGDALAASVTSVEICERAIEARCNNMRQLPLEMRAAAIQDVDKAIHLCESPIEQVALYQLAGFNFGNDEYPSRARILCKRGEVDHYPDLIHIIPQVVFGRYRLDFLVDARHKLFAVECDGKEFHQQKGRDQTRDDYLLSEHRITTYRIPGSAIWAGGMHAQIVAGMIKRSVFP